jgi:hypothetical protein
LRSSAAHPTMRAGWRRASTALRLDANLARLPSSRLTDRSNNGSGGSQSPNDGALRQPAVSLFLVSPRFPHSHAAQSKPQPDLISPGLASNLRHRFEQPCRAGGAGGFCSKQSSRDGLTVEATCKPAADQFFRATSVLERGGAEVTAATTTSAASVRTTNTGRSFDAMPLAGWRIHRLLTTPL